MSLSRSVEVHYQQCTKSGLSPFWTVLIDDKMADISQQEIPEPHTNGVMDGLTEEEKFKMRPADIDADMREMERRKRVEMVMNSRLFREELERIIETQMKDGAGPSGLLQQISEMMGPQGARFNANVFRNSNCVVPINDIRGVESMGYAKGEKMLRCKLAAVFRLLDLYGWTQGVGGQITARLNQDQEHFLVNPYGLLYHEVTASSLVKVDMQGGVVEQGTTNFGVHIAGFQLHSTIHAARPDIKCIVHITTPSVTAISSMKCGLLPLGQESIVIGDVSTHHYISGFFEPEEREKITRNLGPINKIMLLTNRGALCCGETVEEAFFNVYNMVLACETQLKLMPLGLDNLNVISDEARKAIYEASRKPPVPQHSSLVEPSPLADKLEKRWRIGGTEFEALMRMLDNAGFRTGYIYRHPLVKSEPPRPRNDIEVPPAVSSLGYLLEEEELYKQGLWKGGRKGTDRTRWLNSPNVYQKVEILETGTPDPKKITKWVSDGSPTHNNSTPVKIDGALQFVPKNTNPREFKQLQQQIKDYRRADKISAGPQSHILEGVTWEEAKKMQDATISGTGEQVVLVGAASKGIIQRGFQHNAMVYKTPYAKNPFDAVTDQELDQYKKDVERKQKGDPYDESQSESEGLSSFNISRATHESSTAKSPIQSPVSVTSETEEESRDEPRVLRIATKQVPAPSQPEVVFSDANATADFINEMRRAEMTSRNCPSREDVPVSSSVSISCGSGTDGDEDSSHGGESDNAILEVVTKTAMLAIPATAHLKTDSDFQHRETVPKLKRETIKSAEPERASVELSKFEMIRRKFDTFPRRIAKEKPRILQTVSVQSLVSALERLGKSEIAFEKVESVTRRSPTLEFVEVVNLPDETPETGVEPVLHMDEPLTAPPMVQNVMNLVGNTQESEITSTSNIGDENILNNNVTDETTCDDTLAIIDEIANNSNLPVESFELRADTTVNIPDVNGNISDNAQYPKRDIEDELTLPTDDEVALMLNLLDLSYAEIDQTECQFNTEDCYIDDEAWAKRVTRRDSIADVVNSMNADIAPSVSAVASIEVTETSNKYTMDSKQFEEIYRLSLVENSMNELKDSIQDDTPAGLEVESVEDVEESISARTYSVCDDNGADNVCPESKNDDNDQENIPEINIEVSLGSSSSIDDCSESGSDILELPSSTVDELIISGDEAFDKELRTSANCLLAEVDDTETFINVANFVDQILFDVSCLTIPKSKLSKSRTQAVVQDKMTALHVVKEITDDLLANLPCFTNLDMTDHNESKASENETSDDSVIVVEEVIHHLVSKKSRGKFQGNSRTLDGEFAKMFKDTKNIGLKSRNDEHSISAESVTASTPKVKTPLKMCVHENYDDFKIPSSDSKSESESSSPKNENYASTSPSIESNNITEQESGDNDTKSDNSKEKLPDSSISTISNNSPNETAFCESIGTFKHPDDIEIEEITIETEKENPSEREEVAQGRKIDFCFIECIDSGYAEYIESENVEGTCTDNADGNEVEPQMIDYIESDNTELDKERYEVAGDLETDDMGIDEEIKMLEKMWEKNEELLEQYCIKERTKQMNEDYEEVRQEDEESFKHFEEVDEYCLDAEEMEFVDIDKIEMHNPLLKMNSMRKLPPIAEEETELQNNSDNLLGDLFEESMESPRTAEYFSCPDETSMKVDVVEDTTYTLSDDSGTEVNDSKRPCDNNVADPTNTTVSLDFMVYSYDTREFMQLERSLENAEDPICCDIEKNESLTSLPNFEDTSLCKVASRLNLTDSLDSK